MNALRIVTEQFSSQIFSFENKNFKIGAGAVV